MTINDEPHPIFNPQRRMLANALCWCGSGIKWKRCHRDRANEKPIKYFEAAEVLQKSFSRKTCFHPSAPRGCGKVIGAHTLQRRGVLSRIADDGHYACDEGARRLHQTGKLLPARLGINKASTFNGFCSEHDAQLFRPIEMGTVPLNGEAALLFALRAVAHEYYNKYASISADEILLTADAGKSFEQQVMIQKFVHARISGSLQALKELEYLKATLDQAYITHNYSLLQMYALEFASGLPIVSSGAFHPLETFNGIELQSLTELNLEPVIFALTYSGSRSVAIFVWRRKAGGHAETFVNSFAGVPSCDKATAAALLAFVHQENTHLRPCWWEGLDPVIQEAIGKLISTGGLRAGQYLAVGTAPFRMEASIQAETWI